MYVVANSSPLLPGARPSISSEASFWMWALMVFPSTIGAAAGLSADGGLGWLGGLQEARNNRPVTMRTDFIRINGEVSVARETKSIWCFGLADQLLDALQVQGASEFQYFRFLPVFYFELVLARPVTKVENVRTVPKLVANAAAPSDEISCQLECSPFFPGWLLDGRAWRGRIKQRRRLR